MEAKLKSILKLIPWSLLIKAALFGSAWYLLPWWLFIFVALYLYFFPWFQRSRLGLTFLLILILVSLTAPSIPLAVFFAIIFFIIIGLKELLFVNRAVIYEILIFLILPLIFFNFFVRFSDWQGPFTFVWSGLTILFFFFLTKTLLDYIRTSFPERRALVALGIISLLLWQLTWILLFLPLDFISQTALLFFAATFFVELFLDYLGSRLSFKKIFARSLALFFLAGIIFGMTGWAL